MVAVHSYRPNWPDELELSAGDVILVMSKHEEERWFGRLQSGQRGYFPASCVMELSQVGWSTAWMSSAAALQHCYNNNKCPLEAFECCSLIKD